MKEIGRKRHNSETVSDHDTVQTHHIGCTARLRTEGPPQIMYSQLFTQPKPEAGAGDRLLTDLKTSKVNQTWFKKVSRKTLLW